ncbi:hypothetical protein P7H22_18030 [Paenibacillus larvae]|nr:hypothetical protein [Paenibacillus larvae]MDT2241845.1 hypothetical protein [Paenibacillus larvae]
MLLDDSLDKLVAFSALQRLDLGYTVLDAMNPAGQLQDSGTLLPCHNEPLRG